MTPSRQRLAAAVLIALVGLGGCSTVERFNPFNRFGGGGAQPKETAEGERISIVSDDQKLEPAEALKGVDFAIPPTQHVADWPQPGGTPAQAVPNADGPAGLSVAWKRGFGEGSKAGSQVVAPPVEAAGKVFVLDGVAQVAALDAKSGQLVWRTSIRPTDNRRDREGCCGGVAFSDGKVYATSGFREVVQLDANSGKILWRTRTEEPIHGAPTVSGGRVFAVALDNTLMTFDAATGQAGWTYQALSESARILRASSPAVEGDTVVAAFGSGELVALRTANGNDLWNEALSRASRNSALSEIRDIAGRPVIYNGDVFAVSHSGVFAATDLRTGQPRWTLPVVGITTPLPASDVVYVVSRDGKLICAARESGQVYWIKDLNEGWAPRKKGGFFGLFSHTVPKPLWTGPILVDNRLVIGGSNGQVIAVNAKTGAVEQRVEVDAPVLITPIVADGMIYVVTDSAQLVALR
jgi:outer membrane protein assembly factor BamB